MTVRPLDLLDLPFLRRYRRDVLAMDSARSLTRGNPLGAMALLSYLNPRRFIFTAVSSSETRSLMGQVILNENQSSARLTFLAPGGNTDGLTQPLLEALAVQAGEWGAFYLLAEVEEGTPAYLALRQAGFALYAWQRVWKLPRLVGPARQSAWREVRPADWLAVQTLHAQIVPALLQPVDPLPPELSGQVCLLGEQIQAHVSIQIGLRGVWLQPLILPDSHCSAESLLGLASSLPGGGERPVFVCVRSYQAWLEAVLEELGAEDLPRQAVMVKRLVQPIKESQAVQAVEKVLAKAKPAAPVARSQSRPRAKA